MVETYKALDRRVREGFFERYMQGSGVDVGCGTDPVTADCATWDRPNDAHKLEGGPYDWVYSSHCLEHLERPDIAIQSWWSCLKPGGRLILSLPHRDLYEKRKTLPSRWNGEHKTFWMPVHNEEPHTIGLLTFVCTMIPEAETLRLVVEDAGWQPCPEEVHSGGEYSIEGVWRKPSA